NRINDNQNQLDMNKYKKVYYALIVCWGIAISAKSQNTIALNIGDKMPDYHFEALNYPKDQISVSDFAGKLLLFDLWNTRCASCIAQFPKLSELSQTFADQLAIVAVGIHDEKFSDIHQFYTDRLGGIEGDFRLPIAVCPRNDSVFHQLIPYSSVPHVVWIDSERRIIGITGSDAITAENIQACLDGNPPDFGVKRMVRYKGVDEEFLIPVSLFEDYVGQPVFTGYADSLIAQGVG